MSAHMVLTLGTEWEAVNGTHGVYLRNADSGNGISLETPEDAASLEKAAGDARLLLEAAQAAKGAS